LISSTFNTKRPERDHFAWVTGRKTRCLLILIRWLPLALLVAVGMRALAGDTLEQSKATSPRSESVEITAAKPPWGRIVMIGASASAGFTESEPLGGPKTPQYRLSRYVDAALLAPHEPVKNLGNPMFFIAAEAEGRRQINQAIQARPTLVIGLDFLFWFCYGDVSAESERLELFEKGLKMLEAIECPVVLGDIPDASKAVNRMLAPEEIPRPQVMSAANRRLKEWAATRRNVAILSLAGFMRNVAANQAVTIHGHILPEGKTRGLLQSDKLHPTTSGCAVLALAALDAFVSTQPTLSDGEVRWDPNQVFQIGLKSVQEATPKAEAGEAPLTIPKGLK
jgi:hypothetical protein